MITRLLIKIVINFVLINFHILFFLLTYHSIYNIFYLIEDALKIYYIILELHNPIHFFLKFCSRRYYSRTFIVVLISFTCNIIRTGLINILIASSEFSHTSYKSNRRTFIRNLSIVMFFF